MSSYYQESNTSAIYKEFTPSVALPDEYNTIQSYNNFNNGNSIPVPNGNNNINKTPVTIPPVKFSLPSWNVYNK